MLDISSAPQGNYSTNRAWSDRFLPEIRRLVGPHLLQTAPDDLDMTQATDLRLMDARDMRLAARVRRPGYAERYPYEFTTRSRSSGGGETELSKIVNGKGDWMFYGHASVAGDSIDHWWLIDLRAFRAALIRRSNGQGLRFGTQNNPDGTQFAWFDVRSFPSFPPLIVARSDPSALFWPHDWGR